MRGVVFNGRDITDRKELEERLRDSEKRYLALVESSLDLIMVADAESKVRFVNPMVERILGYTPEEFAGMNIIDDALHPDDRGLMAAFVAGAVAESGVIHGPVEARHRHKDGSWRWIEGIINNLLEDPAVAGLMYCGRDMTERREAEEEIRRLNETLEEQVRQRTAQLEALVSKLEAHQRMLGEREEMFRTTFEAAAVGIAHVAPDGRWLRANEKLCEIVGYSQEELLGRTFQDITHSDDLAKDLDHLRRTLAGEIDTFSIEKRYVRKDYAHVWVSLTVSLVRDPSGDPNYFISVIEDITERKRAEMLVGTLTPREVEILRLLAKGRTNREIAEKLTFSVSTVKNHVQNIITTLEASDRTQAAVRAVELGLVEPQQ